MRDAAATEGGDAAGAAAAYQEAIAVAEAQRTPAVALRAATGLGRRWIADGNAEDARCLVEHWLDRVQPVAGLPDYDEARALLLP